MGQAVEIRSKHLLPDIALYQQLTPHLNRPPRPAQQFSVQMANVELNWWEEFATLWLWAYPNLLSWPNSVCWLFSPVTGKMPYPGDIWGVDSDGDLVIVEVKLGTYSARQDPFSDFAALEQRRISDPGVAAALDVAVLRKRWELLYRREHQFIQANELALTGGQTVRFEGPGVIPYSCKRFVSWRWRTLYGKVVVPAILDAKYERQARSWLALRQQRGQPPPHYVGLISASPGIKVGLSKRGHQAINDLRRLATPDRVHYRTMTASYDGDDDGDGIVELTAWIRTP